MASVCFTSSDVSMTCSTLSRRRVIWLSCTISPSNDPLRIVTTRSPIRFHRVSMGMYTSLEKSCAASEPPMAAVGMRGLSTPITT